MYFFFFFFFSSDFVPHDTPCGMLYYCQYQFVPLLLLLLLLG